MSNRISKEDSDRIKILAATGLYTAQEIACDFDNKYNPTQIINHIKTKAPELRPKLRRESSRGAVKLKYILTKIFPHVTIHSEYHVGKKLRLDFYVGEPYNLGFEFDGIQHDKFVEGLHKTEDNYLRSINRDIAKEELCKGRGINLIRVNHSEHLTIDLVKNKIDNIGYGSGYIQAGFETNKETRKEARKEYNRTESTRRKAKYKEFKESKYYARNKEKQKEYRKQQYKKQKEFARRVKDSRRAAKSSKPV